MSPIAAVQTNSPQDITSIHNSVSPSSRQPEGAFHLAGHYARPAERLGEAVFGLLFPRHRRGVSGGRMGMTSQVEIPTLFEHHPNFSDVINRNIIQSEIEGGVHLRDLLPGTVLEVHTQNHVHKIVSRCGASNLRTFFCRSNRSKNSSIGNYPLLGLTGKICPHGWINRTGLGSGSSGVRGGCRCLSHFCSRVSAA